MEAFEDVSHALGLDAVKLKAPRGLIAADVDGDGAPDLIVTQENAPPVLLRNVGANKNHFVRLDLTGYADNKTAIGAKVEVFANGQWQKWELAGASGYQTQAPPQILVGLGQALGHRSAADSVADGRAAGRDRSAAARSDRDEGSGSAR